MAKRAPRRVAQARATKNRVKVGGKIYRSTYQAFEDLHLPIGKVGPFRLKLKANGRETFDDGKKKITFILLTEGNDARR